MKIKVKKEILLKAISECNINDDEKKKLIIITSASDQKNLELDSSDISPTLLSFLLEKNPGLGSSLKAKLSMSLIESDFSYECSNVEEIWESTIKNLGDIVERFSKIGIKNFNADILFNKKWYPVIVKPRFRNATRYREAHVEVNINIMFMDEEFDIGWNIFTDDLKDAFGRLRKPTLTELFYEYGCRKQTCDIDDFRKLVVKSAKLSRLSGKQMLSKGYVLMKSKSVYGEYTLTSLKIGSEEVFEKVIIEPELEYNDSKVRHKEKSKDNVILPFIRVFSLSLKDYVFIDVSQVREYEYNADAISKLFLPVEIKNILTKVFSLTKDNLFGDIINYKHGGMIIMAAGKPGVGKTSTAEVYSELKQIPLYSINISELGTTAKDVEQNLSTIFKRIEKWNAIILFDEVDIFLAKRDFNLERTAIVGIFLRLMDYFQGVMFLTTNRPEVLDYAIRSRVTLKIDYPELSFSTRKQIWTEKLDSAGIKIDGNIDKIVNIELNGREIRNMVRLSKVVFGVKPKQDDIINLINMTYINDEK